MWTDEKVEQLRRAVIEGLSATKIAARLGGGVSRNAVIGKVQRTLSKEGLRLAGFSPKPKGLRPEKQRPFRLRKKDATAPRLPKPEPLPVIVEELEPLLIGGAISAVLGLESKSCRWPYGDPRELDFAFCGREHEGEGPYCRHHARRR